MASPREIVSSHKEYTTQRDSIAFLRGKSTDFDPGRTLNMSRASPGLFSPGKRVFKPA